jgi:hypothetical protein
MSIGHSSAADFQIQSIRLTGGTGLQSSMSIGNGTSGIVVEMGFNIATNDTPQSTNEIVDLSRGSTADSIRHTHTVDTNPVDSLVERKKVGEIGAEGVFGGEADFDSLAVSS